MLKHGYHDDIRKMFTNITKKEEILIKEEVGKVASLVRMIPSKSHGRTVLEHVHPTGAQNKNLISNTGKYRALGHP